MKLTTLTCCAFLLTVTALTLSAADNAASTEKAKRALETLQSAAPKEAKALACKQLAVVGDAAAVPGLAPLLTDPELSSWARIALEVIPGSAADEALRVALGKAEPKLQVGIINSIGVRRDPQAVAPLAAKLADADASVAIAAAIALGRIGGEPAISALQKAAQTGNPTVRSAVAQGRILCAEQLQETGKSAEAAALYDQVRRSDVPQQRILEATRGLVLARGLDGLPLLLELLRAPDKNLHGLGLRTARELPGEAVTKALGAELAQTPAARQVPLLLAIADRSDAEVLAVLIASGRQGPAALRIAAFDLMTRAVNPACVPVLLDAMTDPDLKVIQAAKAALTVFPGAAVDSALVDRLAKATGNAQRAMVELAGQRHISAALPLLAKAAVDTDPTTRLVGIKATGEAANANELGAIVDLLAAARSKEEIAAYQAALEAACARLTDKPGCAQQLVPYLANTPVHARCAILHALGVAGTDKALEAVQTATTATDAAVRDAAVRTLADWAEPPALPALIEVFRSAQDDSHRFLALRGCVRLLELSEQPAAAKTKTFADLLTRTQRDDDRKVILSGLGMVADPAALKLVEPLLTNPAVQAEAELAALGIATAIVRTSPDDAKAVTTRIKTETKTPATRDRAAKLLNQWEKKN